MGAHGAGVMEEGGHTDVDALVPENPHIVDIDTVVGGNVDVGMVPGRIAEPAPDPPAGELLVQLVGLEDELGFGPRLEVVAGGKPYGAPVDRWMLDRGYIEPTLPVQREIEVVPGGNGLDIERPPLAAVARNVEGRGGPGLVAPGRVRVHRIEEHASAHLPVLGVRHPFPVQSIGAFAITLHPVLENLVPRVPEWGAAGLDGVLPQVRADHGPLLHRRMHGPGEMDDLAHEVIVEKELTFLQRDRNRAMTGFRRHCYLCNPLPFKELNP